MNTDEYVVENEKEEFSEAYEDVSPEEEKLILESWQKVIDFAVNHVCTLQLIQSSGLVLKVKMSLKIDQLFIVLLNGFVTCTTSK